MLPRREFLRGLSALSVFSLAGCSDDGEGTDTLTETTRPGTTTVPFTVTETLHDPSTATTTQRTATRTTALTATPATETETSTDMVVAQSDPDTDSQTSTATQSTTTTTTSPTDTMTDQVFWQDGDAASPTNLSQLRAQTNNSDYVERGLSFTPDFTNDELDISTGHAVIYDESTDRAYDVFPDARTNLALTDAATNYVYLMCDPDNVTGSGVDDDVGYHIDTDDTPPTATETSATTISVKVGEVDTSADTKLELQRAPSIDVEELGNGTVNITNRYLAADGSTDDGPNLQTAIESEEGKRLILEEGGGVINIDTQVAPTTTGQRTVIMCVGNPTINVADAEVSGKLDFTGADNITIVGPVTFKGKNAGGLQHAVKAGTGFRFSHLRFEGGRGGLIATAAVSDIRGSNIEAQGLHDTTEGWAGVLDLKGSEIYISKVWAKDCDRGVEAEDGATNVVVESGYLEDINNDQATNTNAAFSLDVHRHDTAADVKNVTCRDWTLVSCEKGPSVSNHSSNGVVENITFENLTTIDTAPPQLEADEATLIDLDAYAPNTSFADGVKTLGGEATLRDIRLHYTPTRNHVNVGEGSRIAAVSVEIDGLTANGGASATDDGVAVGNISIDEVVVRDYVELGTLGDDAIEGGSYSGNSYYALQVYGGDLNNNTIQASGGKPALVEKVSDAAWGTASPPFSHVRAVDGISATDVGTGVAVDGVGTETANAETPQANWPEGTTVDFTDSGDGSGTGVYQLIGSSWVQLA